MDRSAAISSLRSQAAASKWSGGHSWSQNQKTYLKEDELARLAGRVPELKGVSSINHALEILRESYSTGSEMGLVLVRLPGKFVLLWQCGRSSLAKEYLGRELSDSGKAAAAAPQMELHSTTVGSQSSDDGLPLGVDAAVFNSMGASSAGRGRAQVMDTTRGRRAEELLFSEIHDLSMELEQKTSELQRARSRSRGRARRMLQIAAEKEDRAAELERMASDLRREASELRREAA